MNCSTSLSNFSLPLFPSLRKFSFFFFFTSMLLYCCDIKSSCCTTLNCQKSAFSQRAFRASLFRYHLGSFFWKRGKSCRQTDNPLPGNRENVGCPQLSMQGSAPLKTMGVRLSQRQRRRWGLLWWLPTATALCPAAPPADSVQSEGGLWQSRPPSQQGPK